MSKRVYSTPMTPEEFQALSAYANAHGRAWKCRLVEDWIDGRSEGVLQRIRNQRGPSWLATFSLNRAAGDLSRRGIYRNAVAS